VKKMEALSVSVACRVTILIAAILLPVLLTSCGKKGQDGGTLAGEEKTAQESEDDFLDKDTKPDERKYLIAAKPFFITIANQQYAEAYALLSSYAKARMSLNQFKPAEERAGVHPKRIESVDQRDGGTIRRLDENGRGGEWHTARAQDAARVFH
jgi:hypothetical protein